MSQGISVGFTHGMSRTPHKLRGYRNVAPRVAPHTPHASGNKGLRELAGNEPSSPARPTR
jgi:hypothetical protein